LRFISVSPNYLQILCQKKIFGDFVRKKLFLPQKKDVLKTPVYDSCFSYFENYTEIVKAFSLCG